MVYCWRDYGELICLCSHASSPGARIVDSALRRVFLCHFARLSGSAYQNATLQKVAFSSEEKLYKLIFSPFKLFCRWG